MSSQGSSNVSTASNDTALNSGKPPSTVPSSYRDLTGKYRKDHGDSLKAKSVVEETPAKVQGVIKLYKPRSRTTVGHFAATVMGLPEQFIFDIMVEARPDSKSEGKPVISCSARIKAVAEMLDRAGNKYNPSNRPHILQGLADEKNIGKVRMILLLPDMVDLSWSKVMKELDKFAETSSTRCTIQLPEDRTPYSRDKGYNDFLQAASMIDALPATHDGDSQFDPRLPDAISGPTFKPSPEYILHFRAQPSIDFTRSSIRLLTDIAVVPCMPAKPLIQIIQDMIGEPQMEPNSGKIEDLLPKIRKSLLGLKVRCTYVPRRGGVGDEKAKILKGIEVNEGRALCIRNIRMPNDVEPFKVKGGNDVNVYDYFSEKVLPTEHKLNEALPLVQDGSKAWIPIQMLHVDGIQPFTHYNHLTNFIIEKTRSSVDMHYSTIERLYNKVVAQQTYKFDGYSPAIFTKSAHLAKDPSLGRETCTKKRHITVEKRNMKVDTIYISSQAYLPRKGDLHGKVLGGLASLGYEVIGFTAFSKEDVLARKLDALSASDAELIFAIIDNDRIQDGEMQEVVRKLHRWADCDRGVLLVGATKSHLMERYGSKNSPYLPSSLRHKINHMLGRPNFDVSMLKQASQPRKGPLMIVGGHTAHHFDDKTYLPSITAIVANTSRDPSKFLGSCRWHYTSRIEYRKEPGKNDELVKRLVKSASKKVTVMMEDRFKAYEARPSRVLFYFDGAPLEHEAHKDYCEAILKAYTNYFPGASPLQLTYILVNKNRHLKYDESVPAVGNETTAKFAFVTEPSLAAKHRYFVFRNDEQWSAEDLMEMTRSLNTSSQLASPQWPISGSLPTMLARKLCKRAHDYICDDVKPHEIIRKKRVKGFGKLREEYDAEEKALEEVRALVRHEEDPDRHQPWKKALDHYMFYL